MAKLTIGWRLALRVEGVWWVCRAAPEDTMEGAIELGRVHMNVVADPLLRDAFVEMMKASLCSVIEHAADIKIEHWETMSAPEHERSGRA